MMPTGDATPPMLWHYTVSGRLQRILADGALRRSTAGLRTGERAAVWFTLRTTWEPTATPWRRDADGQVRAAAMEPLAAAGLARIGVATDVARTSWAQHRRFGGLPWADGKAVERNARHQGSDPEQWQASYRDVPRPLWARVQVSVDGVTWTDLPDAGGGGAAPTLTLPR